MALELVNTNPIKYFSFVQSKDNGITVDMNTLTELLSILSFKRLQYVVLNLEPEIDSNTTQEEVNDLEEEFIAFLKRLTDIYYFTLQLNFGSTNKSIGIECFNYVPQFV